jgi:hypothetical protein
VTAEIDAAFAANPTRCRPAERLALLAVCALLHLLFVQLLLDTQRDQYRRASAPPVPRVAFVSLRGDTPGAFSPRMLALVDRHLESRPRGHDVAGRRVHGAIGAASIPPPPAARTSVATPEQAHVAIGVAIQPAPAADLPAASAAIDWEAAEHEVARQIASRFSNQPTDALEGAAAGQSSRGMLADGTQRAGLPDCGKIYSGAAILGFGLWQYDGLGDQGCVWR